MNEMEKKFENIKLTECAGNPFQTPEGYFDHLPMRIMERVETGVSSAQGSFFVRYLKPSFGLVAGFLIIFGLVYLPFRFSSTDKQISTFDEVYFLSYTMNDQTISETLEDDSPDEQISNEQLENILIGSVSEYELIVLNN